MANTLKTQKGGCGCRKMLGHNHAYASAQPGAYGRDFDPYRMFQPTQAILPPLRPPLPTCNCLCGCFNPISPIYTGPCPPPPGGSGCPAVGDGAIYGFFMHEGDIAVDAQDPIPFGENFLPTCWGLVGAEDGVVLGVVGVYLVTYTLVIPACEAVDTDLYLTLDGEIVERSRTTVCKRPGDGTLFVTMQSILWAPAGTLLQLVTSNALSINAPSSERVLATLTVYRAA